MTPRTPPNSPEAEQSVLGAALIDPDALRAAAVLIPFGHMMHERKHAEIWDAMLTIHGRKDPVDPTTILDELSKRKTLASIGGAAYLAELINQVPTTANIEYYAGLVQESHELRGMIGDFTKLVDRCYAGRTDPSAKRLDRAILQDAQSMIFKRISKRAIGKPVSMMDCVGQVNDAVDALRATNKAPGVPLPWETLNELLCGVKPAEVTFIAARPNVGKTTFALQMALHAAKLRQPVLFFSLEMDRESLTERLMSMDTGVNWRQLRNGGIDANLGLIAEATVNLSKLTFGIYDNSRASMLEMGHIAREFFRENMFGGIIFLDYIQIQKSQERNKPRHEQLETIANEWKDLAKELHIPVVLISQIGRGGADEKDSRGHQDHLKGSGSLEEVGHTIIAVTRATGKTLKEMQTAHNGLNEHEAIIWNISKNRSGPVGRSGWMRLLGYRNLFIELKEYYQPQQELPEVATSFEEDDDPLI